MNEDDQPSLEQLIGRYGPPPLRISHILLATTVAAVLLSLARFVGRSDIPGFARFLSSGLGIYYVLATAIAATLVMLGIRWRSEGRSFFDQPGHGLLLLQSVSVGVFISASIGVILNDVILKSMFGASWLDSAPLMVSMILSYPLVLGICVWFALQVADSWYWKLYFLIYGLQYPVLFVVSLMARREFFLLLLVQFLPLVFLALLIAASTSDGLKGRNRDWPHWIGVALKTAIYTLEAVLQGLRFI